MLWNINIYIKNIIKNNENFFSIMSNLHSPVKYSSGECKLDITKSEGNMFNPIFNENVQDRNIQGGA